MILSQHVVPESTHTIQKVIENSDGGGGGGGGGWGGVGWRGVTKNNKFVVKYEI